MLKNVIKIFVCIFFMATIQSCYSLKITNNNSVYCKYIGRDIETTERVFVIERGDEYFLDRENQWLDYKYSFNDFESGNKYPDPLAKVICTIKKGSIIRIESVVTKYWLAMFYPYDSKDTFRAILVNPECNGCRKVKITLYPTDLPGEFGYFPPSPGCYGIPIRFVETESHDKESSSEDKK